VYTGHGGRDPNSGRQIANQKLTRGNLALAKNVANGIPVRVIRKVDGTYRYDGLYRVERYWPAKGKLGYVVYRYRLVRTDVTLPDDLPPSDGKAPEKRTYAISRIVRDTQIGHDIKALHKHCCQVCGIQLLSPAGAYAEAAHIRPPGKPHNGPDSRENVLCLCPNHHVLFDLFGFSVASDLSLIGIRGRLITNPKHKPSLKHIEYHREQYRIATKPARK
jgi:putative restriction endonuclease